MQIAIEDLSFDAIIGILDFERVKRQKVVVQCIIEYNYTQQDFINYADVVSHIQTQIQKEQFELLEDALLSLKTTLKSNFPLIQELTLKISKPDILSNCVVSLQKKFKF